MSRPLRELPRSNLWLTKARHRVHWAGWLSRLLGRPVGRRCAALGLLLRRRQILDQPQVEMRRRPCARLDEGHPGQIRDLAVLSHPAAQLIERIRWAGVNLLRAKACTDQSAGP
jgi:hypothetical protein